MLSSIVAVVLGVTSSPTAAPDRPATEHPEAEPDVTARAKAEVAAGREAAKAGDFARALGHFERALALREAPSLHFNIAVCRHNLMLAAKPGTEAYEASRRAAIASYQRYLEAAPRADDRTEVETTIAELGGPPPAAEPGDAWVIERIDPSDVPIAPSLHGVDEHPPSTRVAEPLPEPGAPTHPATAPPPSSPDLPVGRVGLFVPITLASLRALSSSDTMRPLPGLGLGVRGSALLGARHRVAVGGELWATGQPLSSTPRPVLASGGLSAMAEYAHPVANGRLEIGGGGGLGVTLQTLRYSGDTPPPCSVNARGPLSTRAGGLLTARFVLSVLLGARRNHELSLRLSPAFAGFGPGSRASDDDTQTPPCSEQPSPFQSVGLSGRAALVMMIDLGYAPRF